ncbi:hypothetical protein [Edaphobacter aggregans]|uniref:hypothetical protein n=1 Tax=Edaphobacter aggregans TaxID=570835 RepID=UPI000555EB78|nr:hypothetical protein [Edaphobacter aggregans]
MPLPEHNPHPPTGPSLKLLWFLTASVFVASLVASISMVALTMNWLRLKGPDLPNWYSPVTTLSEWGLTLSSVGLLVLAVLTILRSYRNK